jgi:hypothetical protein
MLKDSPHTRAPMKEKFEEVSCEEPFDELLLLWTRKQWHIPVQQGQHLPDAKTIIFIQDYIDSCQQE